MVDTNEVFEPLIDDKMRQLRCLNSLGIGFRRSWQNKPGQDHAPPRSLTEDYSTLLYSETPAGDGSIVTFSSQTLPSIDDSDAAIIGTATYTLVAMIAYCKKADLDMCIDTLSEVLCMNKMRTRKLYADLTSVPSVAHIYNRNLRPDMNPFYKPKAFENEQSIIETQKYQEYQENELTHTRTELLQVVSLLYLSIHIPRYKVSVATEPPHVAVGPAAKIEQRTFYFEVQVTNLAKFHARWLR